MKAGVRKPSVKKSVSARTTGKIKREVKKAVDPTYGSKGMGYMKDPEKAVYNAVYNKTTAGVLDLARPWELDEGADYSDVLEELSELDPEELEEIYEVTRKSTPPDPLTRIDEEKALEAAEKMNSAAKKMSKPLSIVAMIIGILIALLGLLMLFWQPGIGIALLTLGVVLILLGARLKGEKKKTASLE